MVRHVGSASSQVSPPEEISWNRTEAVVGAAVVGAVGTADGDVVGAAVGLDGAAVVGDEVGPQSQRHLSLELHPWLELDAVLKIA